MKAFKLNIGVILVFVILLSSCNDKNVDILVGTYTSEGSEGIYKVSLDKEGNLYEKHLLVKSKNPSYLTYAKNSNYLYAIDESEIGLVNAYKWNKNRSQLIKIDSIKTKGKHPCYISINEKGNAIAFANYSSGNVGVIRLNDNGTFIKESKIIQHKGKGKVIGRQDAPHAHCSVFKSNDVIYAVDLGVDKIFKYSIDNNDDIKKEIALESKKGDGFRHLTFHPSKEMSYVINEFSNTIIVSEVDKESGLFNPVQKISTLVFGVVKESFAADIHISNDGKFLYASNRGHNSISVFYIDDEGKLTFNSNVFVEGVWPRNFMLTKNDKFLIVANQFSNNIVVFKRDLKTGGLTFTGSQIKLSSPVFLTQL